MTAATEAADRSERHMRIVSYLAARLLDEAFVVVGRSSEDAFAALRQALRIAAERDLPLELVAPDRFLSLAEVQEKGVSRYAADVLILTPEAFSAVNHPVCGAVLAVPGPDLWEYEGLGRFVRRIA